MKAFTLFILAFASIAHAEYVTINYPSFQGKPILARGKMDIVHDSDIRAHMVCRMAGYARAKVLSSSYTNVMTSYEIGGLVAANNYFVPDSIVTDMAGVNGWGWVELMHDHYKGRLDQISSTRKPVFQNHKRINNCAKASLCRGFDLTKFLTQSSYDFEFNHPFVRGCMRWGTENYGKEPFVFTQITCETKPHYAAVEAEMKVFHTRTNNQFKVVSGDPLQMGLQFADSEKSCAPFARVIEGSLQRAEPFTCEYQPFDPILMRHGLNVFAPSFMNYISLTNRYRTGPRPADAGVRSILADYTRSVIPTEYNMTDKQLDAMSLPFCVSSTSAVEITHSANETNCSFEVQTRDFLQSKNTLTISYGIENSTNRTGDSRCDTLHKSFNHPALSCEKANFCPAPGTILRSRE